MWTTTVSSNYYFSTQHFLTQNLFCIGIRAGPDIGFQLGTYEGGLNSAILRYIGAPDVEPNTNQTVSLLALNETDLHVCLYILVCKLDTYN